LTLEAGDKVRGVVRNPDQITELLEFVEFVVLTDLTTPHAFDSVMDGVSYVIYVASPMVHLVSLFSNLSQRLGSVMLTPKIRAMTTSEICLGQP
jgi:uncharacterized protein YbjT (DUF2867 family)